MPNDCFLSYASADIDIAQRVHSVLSDAGLNVWLDKRRLQPGVDWHRELASASEDSRVVIPILTPNWKHSEWTRFETYGAESVIPLHAEGNWADVSTPPLHRWQTMRIEDLDLLAPAVRARLAQPCPRKSERIHVLRHRISPFFSGRENDLLGLHERLFQAPEPSLTRTAFVQVITGLRGVGKTTLARHYADKYWRCYRQIFWVDCRSGLENGFAAIFDQLNIEQNDRELTIPEKAASALRDLSRTDIQASRLIILDNAPDEDAVQNWIPATGNCHVLVTSYFSDWSSTFARFPLWVLDEKSAIQFLLKRSDRAEATETLTWAEQIVKSVGYLPLALEQAGAYLSVHHGMSLSDYWNLYKANERKMLLRETKGTTDYPDSVYLTWRAAVEQLPLGARALLNLHAFLSPSPFPVKMYFDGADRVTEELEALEDPGAQNEFELDEYEIRNWIELLLKYSMARSEDGDSISIHGLVQAVQRHQLGSRAPAVASLMATLCFENSAPPTFDLESQNLWVNLTPHFLALADAEGVSKEQQAKLYTEVASGREFAGAYVDAAKFASEAFKLSEESLGPTDPFTLVRLNHLCVFLLRAGDYVSAESFSRKQLDLAIQINGLEHIETIRAMDVLGSVLTSAGKYHEAEQLLRRALAWRELELGPTHEGTLASLNNLSALLVRTGHLAEAAGLSERAIAAQRRDAGADHPDTLAMVLGQSSLLQHQGDYEQAEQTLRDGLARSRRVVGNSNPLTLKFAQRLGVLLIERGHLEEGEAHLREALNEHEKLFGLDQVDTLESMSGMVKCLFNQGKYEEGEAWARRLLDKREHLLGPEHPDSITTLSDLALMLQYQEKFDQATPLARRALELREKLLGPEHPATLTSLNNLGLLLAQAGELKEAEELQRRALEVCECTLGKQHPSMILHLSNLAGTMLSRNNLFAAKAFLMQAYETSSKIHGKNHPGTKTIADNLAFVKEIIARSRR